MSPRLQLSLTYDLNFQQQLKKKISMDSIFLILAAPVIGTMGQLFLKLGMRQVGEITLSELKNNNIQVIFSIISNSWILIAIPLICRRFCTLVDHFIKV